MPKYFFVFLVFIFCIPTTQAQEYFKTQKGNKVLTKTQLDERIKNLNDKAKNNTFVVTTSYTIVNTMERNDSIIHIIKYEFESAPGRNEKLYTLEHKAFPDFRLRNLAGKKVTAKDLKGKVTFINLWFVDCVPCRREMPILNKLQEKYKDKVDFRSITFDSKEEVTTFLKTNTYNFDHLVSAKSFLKNDLGVKAYPKIIIVNTDGIVEYIGPGIPPTFNKQTKEVKDFTEKDLEYLEVILNKLLQ
ncbi:TlpA disulfide reductase family protein [uncultured Kordia sp.]|uniref:TlpA family protein disulfide reductase n=1 Tax=uncultured Kordia sp. TaxID=507699 RepID=UPI00261F37D4|nr:TlpA disulfide reductase family protein [uncultured Kordia sp.]